MAKRHVEQLETFAMTYGFEKLSPEEQKQVEELRAERAKKKKPKPAK